MKRLTIKRETVSRLKSVDKTYNQSHFLHDRDGANITDGSSFHDLLAERMTDLGDGPLDLQEFFESVLALSDFPKEELKDHLKTLKRVLKQSFFSTDEQVLKNSPILTDLYQPAKVLHHLVNHYGNKQALIILLELYVLTELSSVEMYCLGAYLYEIMTSKQLELLVFEKQYLGEDARNSKKALLTKRIKAYIFDYLLKNSKKEKWDWIVNHHQEG